MVFGEPEYAGIEPKPKFLFPVQELTGTEFRLVPFEADRHASAYWNETGSSTELYAYMRMGPFNSREHFTNDIVNAAENNPTTQLYAVMTTRKPRSGAAAILSGEDDAFAGITGFCEASKSHLKVEIGPVILLPQYHGVGLGPAVVELMVQQCFKDISDGGWGLRRVSWMTHVANTSSIKLAERLKFRKEGVMKWDMILADGKAKGKVGNGRALPPLSDPGDVGRDSFIYARYWDD